MSKRIPYDFGKLAADVKAAYEAGIAAAATVPDTGSMNTDKVYLKLPGKREEKVYNALSFLSVSKTNWLGAGYLIDPNAGRAWKQTKCVETMVKHLETLGYDVLPFYRMD